MTEQLKTWKADGSRAAFCLVGARQTGKTTVVEEFARKEYSQFIKLDFLDNQMAADIFDGKKNADEILMSISALTGKGIVPGNTLILLDEIQECPNARTAVKYLVQDQRCNYVETGSMPGVKINKVKSYPVGYESVHLYQFGLKPHPFRGGFTSNLFLSLGFNIFFDSLL